MKNQYWGDVNDYRKYSVIRALTKAGVPTVVCWMLTSPDLSNDGARRAYLTEPGKWRSKDPELFDFLLAKMTEIGPPPTVGTFDHHPTVLGAGAGCWGFTGVVPHEPAARLRYMERLVNYARGARLVYFDSDNGMEVPSTAYGEKGCDKYLFDHEAEGVWRAGHSLLLYQHFPRVKRLPFLTALVKRLATKVGVSDVWTFVTPNQGFILLAKQEDVPACEAAGEDVAMRWHPAISVYHHGPPDWVPTHIGCRPLTALSA